MTLKEWIKNKIINFLGLEQLTSNPKSERITFISDEDAIKAEEIKANRIWYVGNGDELLNFYTERDVKGFNDNPIYNRNKRNYFWSLSAQECGIKRIHSGIPHAIVETISNIIGMPTINLQEKEMWDKISEENEFENKLTQQARPLTLACGYGAWKINFNDKTSKYPLLEYYDAEYVEYIYKSGMLTGIMFKSFYKNKKDEDFCLIETRYKKDGNSYIEYALFRLKTHNIIEPVEFDEIPELSDLSKDPFVIEGLNEILAVPSRYFYDVLNPKYGKSIYAGKIDFFDMLDEIWSQASQTNRVSTPVEYYNPEIIGRGAHGEIGLPNLYNRQFVQKEGVPNGEGEYNNDVITTQPDLNFDKYALLAGDVLSNILTGVLSPATLGIDVAKKDNAEAQREKEKITIMTRNNIIKAETLMLKKLVKLSLMVKEYMDTDKITLKDYDMSINYVEFANPTPESVINTLLPMLTQGAISPELFVDKVYTDSLSKEDKEKEIAWIKEQLKNSELNIDDLMEKKNDYGIDEDNQQSTDNEENITNSEE